MGNNVWELPTLRFKVKAKRFLLEYDTPMGGGLIVSCDEVNCYRQDKNIFFGGTSMVFRLLLLICRLSNISFNYVRANEKENPLYF